MPEFWPKHGDPNTANAWAHAEKQKYGHPSLQKLQQIQVLRYSTSTYGILLLLGTSWNTSSKQQQNHGVKRQKLALIPMFGIDKGSFEEKG